MKQDSMNLLGPLEWEDSDFWGKTSKCRRFSIRDQNINGKTTTKQDFQDQSGHFSNDASG